MQEGEASSGSRSSNTQPRVLITPKEEPIHLWGGRSYRPTLLIPFYSHTRKTETETAEDERLGIDRRTFSNLFACQITFPVSDRVVNGIELVIHDCLLGRPLASTENIFQAAKCELEADARFFFELDGGNAARYGQGRMRLSNKQKNRLIELGVPASDFVSSSKREWKRSTTGFCPRRKDWDEVKPHVMMHALRIKFKQTEPFKTYMQNLIKTKEEVFFVEHTKNDRQWADGGDGRGTNFLGKLLTQIFLELREGEEYPLDIEFLQQPNNNFVHYTNVE